MLRLFKQYYPIRNVFFVLGEGLAIYASIVIASWMYLLYIGLGWSMPDHWLYLKALFITTIFQTFLYYNELYDLTVTDTYLELSIRLLQAMGASAILLGGIACFFPQAIVGHWIFLLSLFLMVLLIGSWRYGYALVLKLGLFNQKIILLGSGKLAQSIYEEINSKRDCGYQIDLVVKDCEVDVDFKDHNNKCIACTENFEGLCDTAAALDVQKIVVALKERRENFPTNELLRCRTGGIEILDGNSFYEMLAGKLVVKQTNPGWFIFSEGFHKSFAKRFIKRFLDMVLSLILLIVFLPVMLVLAVLIKFDSRGPVIFSQDRVGQNRKIYMMNKFRSMVDDAEKDSGPVWADDDDSRITRVGRVIRKLRMDEIPQLWNVLKGEMSFVGPRPEREYFVKGLEEAIPYYGTRFTVKPGITGWAQVSYGYGASVDDAVKKLDYDLFYIKNMSIFMDLMIVLRTIKIVLSRKGSR
jgi:sugar transferase (PEP-CTERM system associated)